MPGVAVQKLDSAGGVHLGENNPAFRLDGANIVTVGDRVASHGDAPHSPSPAMVEGEAWYRISGQPVCRAGNIAACGHATTGRDWFRISPL